MHIDSVRKVALAKPGSTPIPRRSPPLRGTTLAPQRNSPWQKRSTTSAFSTSPTKQSPKAAKACYQTGVHGRGRARRNPARGVVLAKHAIGRNTVYAGCAATAALFAHIGAVQRAAGATGNGTLRMRHDADECQRQSENQQRARR